MTRYASAVVLASFSQFILVSAEAQTQLEPIVVTTPSPVVPQRVPARETQIDEAAVAAASQGFSLSIPIDPTFVPVTVVTPDELLRQAGPTLAQALENKPGISSTGFAPASNRPIIRGLSGFRVSTQENGLDSGDVAALSDDHAVPIDPLMAAQVEVVRGPATLRYGSQAIGGVVNATNNRIPTAIPENGVRVETRGGVNSVDNGRDGATIVEAGKGNFAVHADMFARDAEDYNTPRGKQLNSSVVARGNSLGGSFIGRDGYVGVAYSTYDAKYGIPGGEQAEERVGLIVDQEKFQSKGEVRVGAYGVEAIRGWFGHTKYTHDEVIGLFSKTDPKEIGVTYEKDQYEGRVEMQHLPLNLQIGELRGAIGVQLTNATLSAGGAEGNLLPEAKTKNVAGYIFEELQISKPLRLQAAARIENSDVKGRSTQFSLSDVGTIIDEPGTNPARKEFAPTSYSAGLLYELPRGVVARVTAQHVERAPDATELFYRGPHEATATFEVGDPNLKIERADTVEIGLKRATGGFRFDTSLYHTRFNNFVYKQFTGVKCEETFVSCGTVTDGLDLIFYRQRDAHFTGAEAFAELDLVKVWRGSFGVQGQYDFVRARFEDGSNVPKIPPHRLGVGVYYYDTNLLARVSFLHAFKQDDFDEFDTSTPSYNLLNAEVSYTTKLEKWSWLGPEFTLGVRGENLLDDEIRYSTSFKKDEILQPGRNVRVFGTFKLN